MNVVQEMAIAANVPDAARLPHRRHRAERVRDRPRPETRVGRDHDRAAREARPRGAPGRHRPTSSPTSATSTSGSRCSSACSSARSRCSPTSSSGSRSGAAGAAASRPRQRRQRRGPGDRLRRSPSSWRSSRPIVARLVQLAVSRQREYLADASAVELTRNPVGLERALAKIAADPEVLEVANRATQHLYFDNPIKKFEAASSEPVRHASADPRPDQPAARAERQPPRRPEDLRGRRPPLVGARLSSMSRVRDGRRSLLKASRGPWYPPAADGRPTAGRPSGRDSSVGRARD